MSAPTVVFYVSGHGFGHASRIIEVINALQERRPDVRVEVRTSAARWLFDLTVRGPVRVSACECDVGVVQRDSLHPDVGATGALAEAFYADVVPRAHREASLLATLRPALVVADVPPLAFAASALADVPAVALANFTWDWIYDDYARDGDWADAKWVPQLIRTLHGSAREAWRLPMHGGFDGFASVSDLPFVARRSRRGRDATRQALGLSTGEPAALVSFGGFGLDRLPLGRVARESGVTLVTTDVPDGRGSAARASGPLFSRPDDRLIVVDEHALYDTGWRYEDLVAAADVVVTKPGYGIIAECVANDTGILYTDRGRFAEYDVLVREVPRVLRHAFIGHDDLFAGRWAAGLRAVLEAPAPAERAPVDGAEVAAARIAAIL